MQQDKKNAEGKTNLLYRMVLEIRLLISKLMKIWLLNPIVYYCDSEY